MSDATNQISEALSEVAPERQTTASIEDQLAGLKLAVTLLNAAHLEAVSNLNARIVVLESRPAVIIAAAPMAPPTVPPASNIFPHHPLQPTITTSAVEPTHVTQSANPLQSLVR
jgi:hypothetical protein